jgi:small nuclear ribonucleoprotein (snRNP)-like protein
MSVASKNKRQSRTLSSYLKYLEGTELTVELKNGRQWHGVLVQAEESSMNLTLEDARNNPNSTEESIRVVKQVHIRGPSIRYIHFSDDFHTLVETLRNNQDLERSAQNKYKRGLRKDPGKK